MGLSRGARRHRQGAREPWEPQRRRWPCGPKAAIRRGLLKGTPSPCSAPPLSPPWGPLLAPQS